MGTLLVWTAGRVKVAKPQYGGRRGRSRVDEAREILATVVLSHVPVLQYDYQQKVLKAKCSCMYLRMPSGSSVMKWFIVACISLCGLPRPGYFVLAR